MAWLIERCFREYFGQTSLRDVSARHFADIEAVTRLFQLLSEHFDVAAIEIKDCLVAYQIHIEGSGVKKDLLLGDARKVSLAPATCLSARRAPLAV